MLKILFLIYTHVMNVTTRANHAVACITRDPFYPCGPRRFTGPSWLVITLIIMLPMRRRTKSSWALSVDDGSLVSRDQLRRRGSRDACCCCRYSWLSSCSRPAAGNPPFVIYFHKPLRQWRGVFYSGPQIIEKKKKICDTLVDLRKKKKLLTSVNRKDMKITIPNIYLT